VSSVDTFVSDFPYVGWVPTVNSRLSFRHIGEARHPTEAIYANVITDTSRFILAYQRRPLSDVLFQSVIHYLCNISGQFWFVLAAESSGEPISADVIVGTVSLFKSKEDWRGEVEGKVRGAIKEINELRFSLRSERGDEIRDCYRSGKAAAESRADIVLSFRLKRTGEVYFSRPKFRDTELEFASANYAYECGHDFSKWVADQAYFFLRDISHTHQHHRPSSDTILVLQEHDAGDIEWRKNVVFSLYYYVIKSKRFTDAYSLYQSLGVQAYCKAFKGICQRTLGDKFESIPIFDDDALAQSLSARAQEETAKRTEYLTYATMRHSRAANWRTFTLAIIAIVIASLAILIQPRINDQDRSKFPKLHEASDFASEHFLTVIVVCLVVATIVWIFTGPSWGMRFQWGRDLLEISNVRRTRFVIFYLCSAIVVAGLTVFFNWAAVRVLAVKLRALIFDFGNLLWFGSGLV
jgi:hypothetical protein